MKEIIYYSSLEELMELLENNTPDDVIFVNRFATQLSSGFIPNNAIPFTTDFTPLTQW